MIVVFNIKDLIEDVKEKLLEYSSDFSFEIHASLFISLVAYLYPKKVTFFYEELSTYCPETYRKMTMQDHALTEEIYLFVQDHIERCVCATLNDNPGKDLILLDATLDKSRLVLRFRHHGH